MIANQCSHPDDQFKSKLELVFEIRPLRVQQKRTKSARKAPSVGRRQIVAVSRGGISINHQSTIIKWSTLVAGWMNMQTRVECRSSFSSFLVDKPSRVADGGNIDTDADKHFSSARVLRVALDPISTTDSKQEANERCSRRANPPTMNRSNRWLQ